MIRFRGVDRWLALLLLSLFLFPAALHAHSELIEATPAPGVVLEQGSERPDEIRLRFSQPPESGTILLFDQAFTPLPIGEARLDEAAPRELVATLPVLGPGRYTVNWRTVGADGHSFEGSYSFDVRLGTPRAAILTRIVAAVVLGGMALLVYVRRDRGEG